MFFRRYASLCFFWRLVLGYIDASDIPIGLIFQRFFQVYSFPSRFFQLYAIVNPENSASHPKKIYTCDAKLRDQPNWGVVPDLARDGATAAVALAVLELGKQGLAGAGVRARMKYDE